MFKLKPQFKVRIVYKSGYKHDFWVRDFNIRGGSYSWTSVEDNNKPVQIGVDDIAAVWQIGTRYRFAR